MAMEAEAKLKEVTIEAVITRADGTREDLGIIARTEPQAEDCTKKRRLPWRKKDEQ